jgi:hypothetical protein
MDLYPITLVLALAAGASALGLALVARGRAEESDDTRPTPTRRNWARRAGLLGLILSALAAAIHVLTQHRPGTANALDWAPFAEGHSSLVVAAALAAAGIAVSAAKR